MGLFNFLFGSSNGGNDGATPETAIIVQSVAEEYQWLQKHCPGFTMQRQALQDIDGKPYDVLTLLSASGAERTVYFDISPFFGK